MLKEFKEFALKGNVVDLAIGVIIGGAFGKIVSSLVTDIIMPLFGLILGGLNFAGLTIKVGSSIIAYGLFIENVVDFIIIAFVIFMAVKFMNKFNKKEEPKKVKVVKSDEVLLLEEIRNLLKKKK